MRPFLTIFISLCLIAIATGQSDDGMRSSTYIIRNDAFVSAAEVLSSDTLSLIGKFGTAHFHRMESARFKLGTHVQLLQQHQETVPEDFLLRQNFPNPFNQTTTVVYSLPKPSDVEIKVYSIIGRHIVTLLHNEQAAGHYRLQYDGTDGHAAPLPSGVYLLRLKTKGFDKMIKIAILR